MAIDLAEIRDDPTRERWAAQRTEFLSILAERRRLFAADRQGEARYLAGAQLDAWRKLIGYTTKALTSDREEAQTVVVMTQGLMRGIEQSVSGTSISQTASPDGWYAESPLPMLDPAWIEQHATFLKDNAWFCLAAILAAIAEKVNVRRLVRQIGSNDPLGVLADPRLIAASAEVALAGVGGTNTIKSALTHISEAKDVIDNEINRVASLHSRFETALLNHDEAWEKFKASSETDIEAIRKQITDAIKLEASRDLWSRRSSSHLYWMIGAFILMLAGISSVVGSILFFALPALEPTFFEIVSRSGYTTQKLVLITLCVIGGAWVLRFVARAIVENMSLRADAQHRQSMLETYLALRGEVGLKDEERVIILNALFRPLPGQPADENPPTPAGEALQKLLTR